MKSIIKSVAVKASLCLIAGILVTGCSTIDEKRKIDYKSQQTTAPLEVPPDLSAIPGNSPTAGAAPSVTTYSTFVTDKKTTTSPVDPQSPVLPVASDIKIERDGQTRWLVVQQSPEVLWPRVREFVSTAGLIVDRENPVTGVVETDWTENRAKVGTGSQMMLAKWLGSLYSTGTRDKFRIRLERGSVPGTTEVYVTHRGMEEVLVQKSSGESDGSTRWQPRKYEPDTEIEMMRLMVVYLGKTEVQSRAIVAPGAAAAPPAERAHLERYGERVALSLDDAIDSAWRRVGLSLDRTGFTVEDRDRSKGIYYVRYIDPDKPDDQPGFIARMFGAEAKKDTDQYQIHLKPAGNQTAVTVKNKDGAPEWTKTGERIVTLLYEQLK